MPKLIEVPVPRPVPEPTTNAAQMGGLEAQGMQTLGQGLGAVGRAYSAFRDLQADVGAREYEQRLTRLSNDLALEADPTSRIAKFDQRRASIREEVAQARPFANRIRFDRFADLADGDTKLRVEQRALEDTLVGIDASAVQIGNVAALRAADEPELDDAILGIDEYAAQMDSLVNDGTMTQARRNALVESVAVATIRTRVETDPDGADALLERYASVIDPGRQAALRELVSDEGDLVRAQRLSDQAFDQFGRDMDAVEAFIRENSEGKVRESALSASRSRHSAAEAEIVRKRREALDNNAVALRDAFANGPPPAADLGKIWQQTRQQARRDGLGEQGISTLKSLFDALADPEPIATDWGLWNRIYKNPSLVGTEGFTIADLGTRIRGEDLDDLIARSNEVAEGKLPNQTVVDDYVDDEFARWEIDNETEQGWLRSQIQRRLLDAGKTDIGTIRGVTEQVLRNRQKTGSWKGSRSAADSDTQLIERTKEASLEMYHLAFAEASAGGTRIPSEADIAVQIDRLSRRADAVMQRRGPAAHRKFMDDLKQAGKQAVETLYRENYPGLKDMDADAEIRALQARDAEARRQAQAARDKKLAEEQAEQLKRIKAPVRAAMRARLMGDVTADPIAALREQAGQDIDPRVERLALEEVEAEIRAEDGLPGREGADSMDDDLARQVWGSIFVGPR